MRVMTFFWGFTLVGAAKFAIGFSAAPTENEQAAELYSRINAIFSKNKYGYNTRFMSNFDLLLESVLNQRFLEESVAYYDDPSVAKEVEDMEQGLNGEFANDDIKNLLKDTSSHGAGFKSLRYPDRVGNNYKKSDDLSCYKIHPSGSKPSF